MSSGIGHLLLWLIMLAVGLVRSAYRSSFEMNGVLSKTSLSTHSWTAENCVLLVFESVCCCDESIDKTIRLLTMKSISDAKAGGKWVSFFQYFPLSVINLHQEWESRINALKGKISYGNSTESGLGLVVVVVVHT